MPAANRRTLGIVGLILVLVTGLLYLQVRHHQFLQYDDDKFLVDNLAIQQGLDAEAIRWAFTNNHASLWLPVTWISHTIDFSLFGDNAGAHHLVNLLQHLLNTVLLLLVLTRMTGRFWPSVLVAALFALHPLHVESVAWVTERKDTLSTLFLLLTMAAYERWVRRGARSSLGLALLFCALGLMAKPMLVTLPVLLLILDLWPLDRLTAGWRRLLVEKIPFALLAAGTGVVTLLVGRAGGIVAGLDTLGIWPRLANALVSTATYPLQMFWPVGLRAQYVFRSDLPLWMVVAAAAGLGAVTWLAVRWRRERPWFAAGWAWYLVSLAPVSGVLQQGSHAMADRYTYVSLLGLFVMVAWGGAEMVGRWPRTRIAALVLALLVLVAMGGLTARQAATWHDTVTLFEHARTLDPDDPMVLAYLGAGLAADGRHAEAVLRLEESLAILPDRPLTHLGLARSLAATGDHAGAARHYRIGLAAYPEVAAVHFEMGTQLMLAGQPAAAVAGFRRTLELEPGHTGALTNLGLTLLDLERFPEAEAVLRRLVTLAPGDPLAHYNLACGLSLAGDTAGSALALESAVARGFHDWAHIRTDPDLANLRATPEYAPLVERLGRAGAR